MYVTLKRKLKGFTVMAQKQKPIWESDNNRKTVRADIVVENNDGDIFVLDTKWKTPRYGGKIVPSDADLHQMYVYFYKYGDAREGKVKKVALLYPGDDSEVKEVKGWFVNDSGQEEGCCDMLFLPCGVSVEQNHSVQECRDWQESITSRVIEWLKPITSQQTV